MGFDLFKVPPPQMITTAIVPPVPVATIPVPGSTVSFGQTSQLVSEAPGVLIQLIPVVGRIFGEIAQVGVSVTTVVIDHTSASETPAQLHATVITEVAVPASVIHLGRETVFPQPPAPVSHQPSVFQGALASSTSISESCAAGSGLAVPALPQKAGRPDSPSVAAGPSGGALVPPSPDGPAQGQVLDVIRDVLARLDLLPQGVKPEEALPKFQEVIRLWQAGSRDSNLPPDVVRVVNYFLTSAAILVDLPNLPPQGQGPRLVPNQGSTQLPTTSPLLPSVHLSTAKIAQAVLSILAASRGKASTASEGLPTAFATAHNGSQTASRATSANAGSQVAHQLGPQTTAASRGPALAQTAPLLQAFKGLVQHADPRGLQEPSEPSRLPRPLGRSDEELKREGLSEEPNIDPRVSRDKGTFSGSQEGERERDDEEVLEKTLAALQENGFLDSSTDLIRIRPLQEADVKPLLNLLASLVPHGSDLMDLLALMARYRISWSGNKNPVNDVFHRLANYRSRSDRTKVDLLLEPIMDMGLLEMDLLPDEEQEIRQRYTAHVPIVERYLSNEEWFGRLESDREFLGEELAASKEHLHSWTELQ